MTATPTQSYYSVIGHTSECEADTGREDKKIIKIVRQDKFRGMEHQLRKHNYFSFNVAADFDTIFDRIIELHVSAKNLLEKKIEAQEIVVQNAELPDGGLLAKEDVVKAIAPQEMSELYRNAAEIFLLAEHVAHAHTSVGLEQFRFATELALQPYAMMIPYSENLKNAAQTFHKEEIAPAL